MGQLTKLSVKNNAWMHGGHAGTGFRFATRYIDFLVVPWILDPVMIVPYLAARSASLFIPVSLGVVGRRVAPHLAHLVQTENHSLFRAAAARVNLGYMIVCGAVALIVLSMVPLVERTGSLHPSFEQILLWMVIGQSAPVLFGATGLLMQAVERGAFCDLLLGVTAILFLVGIWLLEPQDGLLITQILVAAQLSHAAICALLLTQCGVWPGFTALFHKEIKLY